MTSVFQTLKFLAQEIGLDLLYFPVWWYSSGLKRLILWIGYNIRAVNHQLVWTLLGRYLFTPMYGDYTKSGRLISFFVRLVQYLVISVLMLIATIVNIIMIPAWLLLPLVTCYGVIINLFFS